jgi:putative CocE/NonD family hydrolase
MNMFYRNILASVLLCLAACGPATDELDRSSAPDELAEVLRVEQSIADTSSTYIVMRDGVRLAIDLHLPRMRAEDEKIPALLYQTLYQRSHRTPLVDDPDIANPDHWQDQPRLDHRAMRPIDVMALKNGYAIVKVDVRGTGASFGSRLSVLPPEEVQDTKDVIDWVVAQDWSNGNVGAYGVSYTGMTAGLAPIVQHPALKAVVLGWSGIYDEYKTAMQPYGLVQPGVLCTWSDLLVGLWSNDWRSTGQGAMPVAGDEGAKLLIQALEEHKQNETVCDLLMPVTFSDDVIGPEKLSIQTFSQRDYKEEIEASRVAMLSLASWYDTGASDAHFVRLRHFNNAQKIFLTGGQHGARHHASPYLVSDKPIPPIPSGEETWGKAIVFFDYYLKGIDNGYDEWPVVTYWNLGEEKFRSSGAWPVEGTEYLRLYFNEDHTLTHDQPSQTAVADVYDVNFDATTGKNSRWWSGIGLPMLNLSDRRAEDEKLLVYTSEPLAEDLQITGWPIIKLDVSSTHADGAFIAYLEDVDETGRSIYVNEGGLRALHRKVSDNPVDGLPTPYHSFEREDASPLVPGEITTISFEMIPVSVRIAKGHRVRIAIAGADKDNFVRIPETGDPTITVHRSQAHSSYIDLPIVSD